MNFLNDNFEEKKQAIPLSDSMSRADIVKTDKVGI